ncbi:uncharacterized protein LJ206_003039 isoform 1-T1 [Theristicus caerulescens]
MVSISKKQEKIESPGKITALIYNHVQPRPSLLQHLPQQRPCRKPISSLLLQPTGSQGPKKLSLRGSWAPTWGDMYLSKRALNPKCFVTLKTINKVPSEAFRIKDWLV